MTSFTEVAEDATPLATTCIDDSRSGTLYNALMLHGGDYAIALERRTDTGNDDEIHSAMSAP